MYEFEKYNILHPICEESIELFLNLTLIYDSNQNLFEWSNSIWLSWIKKLFVPLRNNFIMYILILTVLLLSLMSIRIICMLPQQNRTSVMSWETFSEFMCVGEDTTVASAECDRFNAVYFLCSRKFPN